jgi:glucose-6-phosphate 1-dehydrogenase
MATIITPSIDEDIQRDIADAERASASKQREEERIPEPLALVIFGATGDLTHRKLIPALYNLACEHMLPQKLAIIGFGRSSREQDQFRQGLRAAIAGEGVQIDDQEWQEFAEKITYLQGGYDEVQSFHELAVLLDRMDAECGTQNHRLFYLSTPPNVYADVVANLGAAGLSNAAGDGGWVRLIVEKPFGHDLPSAQQLDHCVHEVFDESQVYRIDHYLGKETVQNIFALRFANGIFEPLWNRNYVDHVEITAAEQLGVEGRGGYYEEAGAVRDMLQSHLLQLLSLTAMEPPSSFTPNKVRDEKVKVLEALNFPDGQDELPTFVRGQYISGLINGKPAPSYREENGVAPDSRTETYIAVRLMVDTWRWAGVPFYLRTGKRLPKRVTEIAITFRRPPHHLLASGGGQMPRRNVLVLRIQPDDGVALRLDIKVPGPSMRVRPVDLSFLYKEAFHGEAPEAYQRLLLDAMLGDSTLFARTDEVQHAWRIVTPLLKHTDQLGFYTPATWGPVEADRLIVGGDRRWRTP